MIAVIEHLRALVDGEWMAEEARADALRCLAELEAGWDAAMAPADVETATWQHAQAAQGRFFDALDEAAGHEARRAAGRLLEGATPLVVWPKVVRPLVEKLERAKSWAQGERDARRMVAAELIEARAEVARLKAAPGEECAACEGEGGQVHDGGAFERCRACDGARRVPSDVPPPQGQAEGPATPLAAAGDIRGRRRAAARRHRA